MSSLYMVESRKIEARGGSEVSAYGQGGRSLSSGGGGGGTPKSW